MTTALEPLRELPTRLAAVPARLRLVLALVLDAALVFAFVAIGRQEHDDTSAARNLLEIAAPFWIGLAVGWLTTQVWRAPWAIRTGLLIWPFVIVVGMLVRRLGFDDGTAPAFVIVATLFTGACLVGWRVLARLAAGSAD